MFIVDMPERIQVPEGRNVDITLLTELGFFWRYQL
jgi:hypothetical protein